MENSSQKSKARDRLTTLDAEVARRVWRAGVHQTAGPARRQKQAPAGVALVQSDSKEAGDERMLWGRSNLINDMQSGDLADPYPPLIVAGRAATKPPLQLKEPPQGGGTGGVLRPAIEDRCPELRPPAAITSREFFGGDKVDHSAP